MTSSYLFAKQKKILTGPLTPKPSYERWPSQSRIALVRDPLLWFDLLAPMLLGALSHHDPQLRYKLRAATAA
jgi:hypothetical protein